MTAWQLHWGIRELGQYLSHMLSFIVKRMLNLSVISVGVVIMHLFVFYLCFFFTINVMSFTV